jgi:hypothetical protein
LAGPVRLGFGVPQIAYGFQPMKTDKNIQHDEITVIDRALTAARNDHG